MRILEACAWIEAGGSEEFPVALHTPIDPPRPHFLALSPASDLDSGHAGPFFPFVSEILACVRSGIAIFSPGLGRMTTGNEKGRASTSEAICGVRELDEPRGHSAAPRRTAARARPAIRIVPGLRGFAAVFSRAVFSHDSPRRVSLGIRRGRGAVARVVS